MIGHANRHVGEEEWEEEPVAICRLKRVAADNKGEIAHLLPEYT